MANAKSNIYPIQLQGAELCLNRYDAEIKQYSGFNKNNSPFVGGCLSNVFTKEEQISGGNDDNVYIDENGDVYRVDLEGFYKNENKIVDYGNSTKFYEKRKLKIKNNVIKMYSEDIYISQEDNNYVAHWGEYSEILGTIKSVEESFLDISYNNGCAVFTYKRYYLNNDLYAFLYVVIVPDVNNAYCSVHKPQNEFDTTQSYICCRIPINFVNEGKFCPLSQAAYIEFKEDEDNIIYVFVAFNEDNGNLGLFSSQGMKDASCLNLFRIGKTPDVLVSCRRICDFLNPYEVQCNLFTTYLCAYYMTNDGVFHFNHLPYNEGSSVYSYNTYTFPASQNLTMNLNIKLSYSTSSTSDHYVIGKLESVENGVDYYGSTYSSNVWSTTIKNKDVRTYYGKSNNVFIPYGVSFMSSFVNSGDASKELILAFSNEFKIAALLQEGNELNVNGAFFIYGDFKILLNNGNITSISVCDASINYHGVILEDWNTIENFIIPAEGDRIIYKKVDGFYEIRRTNIPKIFKRNNQLVVNCNSELNSYNLETSKILHYGSDWNCSYQTLLIRAATYSNKYNAYYGDVKYIATAINEYNLSDNPSIILNARQYLQSDLMSSVRLNEVSSMRNFNPICAINYYIGDITAYYLKSLSTGLTKNQALIDLPFPNNTDGNVQSTPNLFSNFISDFGIDVFVKNDNNVYQLMKEGQENVMAYFLGTLIEGLELVFILQGQYYGVIDNKIFGLQFNNGVIADTAFIVNIRGLQFVGNTPYEALFFSKTNRCLYSFTGANVLNQKQLVDKISEVRNYLYNPATQTVFLITDIGVLFYGLFGMFLLEYTNITSIFLLDNGIVMSDNNGNYHYIKYYLDEGDTGYEKQNIRLETSFYGMNNEMVTINDCLYFRIFSEEHEEGDLKVSATTISLSGRKTEETTFKIKASDWDKITHTIYLRYQPKTQRGLGVAFAIDSPFKIASMSVGSQPDAVLVDKVSKGAITAPSVTTNNNEW